jgi:hypothetical protein
MIAAASRRGEVLVIQFVGWCRKCARTARQIDYTGREGAMVKLG